MYLLNCSDIGEENIEEDQKLDEEKQEEVDSEDIDVNVILTTEEEDKMMHEFGCWLMSPDGVLKNMRSANQHGNVVMNILHSIDNIGKDYSKLFCRQELNAWVSHFENKGGKTGTIKTYLNSVQQFYDYVAVLGHPSVNVKPSDIQNMKILVSRWCRNYRKKIQIHKHVKMLADLARLPKPDDIRLLDKSQHVSESLKILSKLFCVRSSPSRNEFCHVRDYVFTYIILENASRPGCISNMTMRGLEKTEMQQDGSYIIAVVYHKTIATAGPAMLSITPDLMRHLRIFHFVKIRNSLPGMPAGKKDPVFVEKCDQIW